MDECPQHPGFARAYLRVSERADLRGGAEHRTRLLAGLSGRVIEVGAGNGRNFSYYPPSVTEVLAIEPDDILREAADRAAAAAPVRVRVMAGHAARLPVEPAGFDAAVASLVLCSVPDQARALAELWRVLRPGGQLRFYEHVRSQRWPIAAVEDLITPLWSRMAGGCHPNRDTVASIHAAGFVIDPYERFSFSPCAGSPRTAHILGQAHRTGEAEPRRGDRTRQ